MYPSIIISHNIGTETMIGKLILDGFGKYNPDPTDTLYDQGKFFIEDYLTYDYTYLGNRYFNLPDTVSILKDLEGVIDEESSE